MSIFRLRAGLVLVLASLAVAPSGLNAQSLTDALIHAYRSSELLKSNRAALRATDETVAQTRAALRPSLTATASGTATGTLGALGSSTYTNNVRLSYNLLLWDGGSSGLAVDVARMNVSSARRSLVDMEQGVLLNAVTAFMDMRRDLQFLDLAESNLHVIAQQVQAAKDRFDVGDVTRTAVSQAEARFAGAVSNVAFRQGNLEIAREMFFFNIGSYPGVLLAPPPPPRIPATLGAAKSVALRTHPLILQAQDNLKVAELNVYRAQAAMKPKFTMTGNLNSSSSIGDTATIAINGSLPIYAGGALVSAERQARAYQEKAHADVHQAGLTVSRNVNRYWATTRIARASITARQKQVRAARVALRGVREEASLGARTTLDVLDAEQELFRAQSDLAAAKRDEYVAVYSLLSAMGLLTVNHLKLGIKTYNAEENYKKVYLAPVKSRRAKLLDGILKRAGKN